MEHSILSRRAFAGGIASVLGVSLAGCADDDGDDPDDDAADGDADGTDVDDGVDDADADDADADDADADDTDADDEATDDADTDDDAADDADDADEDEDDEDQGSALTVVLEDGEGEPVSEGVTVNANPEDGEESYLLTNFEEGSGTVQSVAPGEYTVVAEHDELGTAEESVTVEDEDAEITLAFDEALEEEGENGADEDDEDEGDGEEEDEDDGED